MNFIVVVDKKYGIGKNNGLLTHLTDDLKYFRRVTQSKVVVMGRKTLESLPKGKPFSNRINIVLTKDIKYTCEGAKIVHNLDELYQASVSKVTETPTGQQAHTPNASKPKPKPKSNHQGRPNRRGNQSGSNASRNSSSSGSGRSTGAAKKPTQK
jgi:hypothetical protein